ncbi:MAG: hypothetical protein LQ343_005113 [Gyalolechia ehrenbergii]|nr:MAG: hypothetical protein LQ343_005113 [Gyalolechia ehrenbergii]
MKLVAHSFTGLGVNGEFLSHFAGLPLIANEPTRPSPLRDPGAPTVTAYASFRACDLSNIAILSLELLDQIIYPEEKKPQTIVQLKDFPGRIQAVQVKRLTVSRGLTHGNLMWGEECWTYQRGDKAVKVGNGPETLR